MPPSSTSRTAACTVRSSDSSSGRPSLAGSRRKPSKSPSRRRRCRSPRPNARLRRRRTSRPAHARPACRWDKAASRAGRTAAPARRCHAPACICSGLSFLRDPQELAVAGEIASAAGRRRDRGRSPPVPRRHGPGSPSGAAGRRANRSAGWSPGSGRCGRRYRRAAPGSSRAAAATGSCGSVGGDAAHPQRRSAPKAQTKNTPQHQQPALGAAAGLVAHGLVPGAQVLASRPGRDCRRAARTSKDAGQRAQRRAGHCRGLR